MANNNQSAPPRRSFLGTMLRLAIALVIITTGLCWAIDYGRPALGASNQYEIDKFRYGAFMRLYAVMQELKTR